MTRLCLAVGIMAMVSLDAHADPAGDDMKKLEGTWVVQSATLDGKPFNEIKSDQMVFAGNKLTVKKAGGKEEKGTFKVDPTRKPKTMDFVPEKKKPGESLGEAIYELDGDKLTICIGPMGERPTKFTDKAGPLIKLKRKK